MKTQPQTSRRKNFVFITGVCLGALLVFVPGTLTGCGSKSATLVTVDGKSITIKEFNEYLATKRTVRASIQGQIVEVQVSETLGFQALQELTTRRLVIHMAADAGLAPTKQDIKDEIDFRTSLNPKYLENLRTLGHSMGRIRDEVEYSLAEEWLQTRGIEVTMAEVEKRIAEHPEQFKNPATADIFQVFVLSEERKDEVDEALNSAQGFAAVAARFNQAPEGHRVQLQIDRLAEPIKSIIENAPIASTTDWVATAGGFKRFNVVQRTAAKMIDLTPNRKKSILRQMAFAYGRLANDLNVELTKRLKGSEIIVSDDQELLKTMWKRFEDRIEQTLKDSDTQEVDLG